MSTLTRIIHQREDQTAKLPKDLEFGDYLLVNCEGEKIVLILTENEDFIDVLSGNVFSEDDFIKGDITFIKKIHRVTIEYFD